MTIREKILKLANEAITKNRNLDYGTPEDNFSDIGRMYSIYKENNRPHEHSAHDVAIFCILIKICRIKQSPNKEDHWVDIAGYAGCGGQSTLGKPNAKIRPRNRKLRR